jgi:hypothetical protein
VTTVKRYARTLDEAFKGPTYAGPITTPRGRVVGYLPSARRCWWRDAAAKVALYVALVRAGLRGELR